VVLLRDNTTVIVERNDEGHFEYLKKQISKSDEELKQELMILEMQLAAVNGRLCTGNANGAEEELEKEYKEILEKLKEKRMLVRT
jgi:hypothetical protein